MERWQRYAAEIRSQRQFDGDREAAILAGTLGRDVHQLRIERGQRYGRSCGPARPVAAVPRLSVASYGGP